MYINNTEVSFDRKNCITSISISEDIKGSDTLTVTVQDPELEYIEDNIFKDNSTVRVELGWNEDSYTYDFDGYISAVDIDFPSNGIPTINLTCLDQTHRMNRVKKTRTWENTTSAKVVELIAKEYGYSFVCEKSYKYAVEDSISQSDQTDIEFLESLAGEEIDLFVCKLIGKTIYYIKQGVLSNPVYSATYRTYPYDLVSFSPKINIEQKTEKTQKTDVSNKKVTDTSTQVSSDVGKIDSSVTTAPTSINPTRTTSFTQPEKKVVVDLKAGNGTGDENKYWKVVDK